MENNNKKSKNIKTAIKGKIKKIKNNDKNNSKIINLKGIFKKNKNNRTIESNINSRNVNKSIPINTNKDNTSTNSTNLNPHGKVSLRENKTNQISSMENKINENSLSNNHDNYIENHSSNNEQNTSVLLNKNEAIMSNSSSQLLSNETYSIALDSSFDIMNQANNNLINYIPDPKLDSKHINSQIVSNEKSSIKEISNTSSRRSSVTFDSCRTMNNDNENYSTIPTIISKDKKYIDNEHIDNVIDEISILKNKSNSNVSKDSLGIDQQNKLGLKLKNNEFINSETTNKLKFLNNSEFLYEDSINLNQNKIYTVNTAIINLNKPNIDSKAADSGLLSGTNEQSNGEINNNGNSSNSNSKNKEEIRSRSSSSNSINTLNSVNSKYSNITNTNDKNESQNNDHLKNYNRHGSMGSHVNSPDNKNSNKITKKAIINNVLKTNRNNNLGVIYTKRNNSMNNINNLKLKINNFANTDIITKVGKISKVKYKF